MIFNWLLFIAGEEFGLSVKKWLELIILKVFGIEKFLINLSEDSSVDWW